MTIRVGVTSVPQSARGWIHKAGNDGFIKLVEDADRGVLAGATSVGPWGGEVLSALAVAVHARVPVQRLREMIYAYPTFHRAIEAALDELASDGRAPGCGPCDQARTGRSALGVVAGAPPVHDDHRLVPHHPGVVALRQRGDVAGPRPRTRCRRPSRCAAFPARGTGNAAPRTVACQRAA